MEGSLGPAVIAVPIVVLLVLIAIWAIIVRNGLVSYRNKARESLSGIDVALEARYDQITAQKDVVKGAVAKEIELILGATALRTGRSIPDLSVEEKSVLAGSMQQAEGLLLSVEAYPTMESQKSIRLLQRTINEVEERLQASRRLYNSSATTYNTKAQLFPQNIVATIFGFKTMDLFGLSNAAKSQPVQLEGFLD